jgi:nitroreductase
MVEVMEIIKGRRSIRKFQEKPVPDKIFQRILETIGLAPLLAEGQYCKCEVILIKDQRTKEKLREVLDKTNPANNAVVQAPVVFAICGKIRSSADYRGKDTGEEKNLYMFELGIATQTLCLSAHSLGLGTVIVGTFDHIKAKEILEMPEDHELQVLIPLGYPAETPAAPKRREISELIHYDKF